MKRVMMMRAKRTVVLIPQQAERITIINHNSEDKDEDDEEGDEDDGKEDDDVQTVASREDISKEKCRPLRLICPVTDCQCLL